MKSVVDKRQPTEFRRQIISPKKDLAIVKPHTQATDPKVSKCPECPTFKSIDNFNVSVNLIYIITCKFFLRILHRI